MKRMILIESFEYLNADSHGRWTRLKCGYTSHISATRTGYNRMGFSDQFTMNPEHQCTPRGVGVDREHWRTVVRDCFLDGRDAEAIQIICASMNLVSP